MTDEQIIKLAKTCGFDEFQKRKYDGESDYGTYWECWEDHLLLFAKVVYEEGYEQHRKDILGEELYYG